MSHPSIERSIQAQAIKIQKGKDAAQISSKSENAGTAQPCNANLKNCLKKKPIIYINKKKVVMVPSWPRDDFEKKNPKLTQQETAVCTRNKFELESNEDARSEHKAVETDINIGTSNSIAELSTRTPGIYAEANVDDTELSRFNIKQCFVALKRLPEKVLFVTKNGWKKRESGVRSGKKRFACDERGKQFQLKFGMKRHKITHSGENPFKCDECTTSFSLKHNLMRHKKMNRCKGVTYKWRKDAIYECYLCSYVPKTITYLRSHMVKHVGKKLFHCSKCPKKYAWKTTLYVHMCAKHKPSAKERFECSTCSKIFLYKHSLQCHKKVHTASGKPFALTFACNQCGHKFQSQSRLVAHKQNCIPKPFICKFCPARFVTKDELSAHIERHVHCGPSKLFECFVCKRIYDWLSRLRQHMMTHLIATDPATDPGDDCLKPKNIEEERKEPGKKRKELERQRREQQLKREKEKMEKHEEQKEAASISSISEALCRESPDVDENSTSPSSRAPSPSKKSKQSVVDSISVKSETTLNQTQSITLISTSISITNSRPDSTIQKPTPPQPAVIQVPKGSASEWVIEEVVQFIMATDPALAVHADVFRKHEIDGEALLLLNSNMMMKHMGLKLGPALKICNIISRLNNRRHMSSS